MKDDFAEEWSKVDPKRLASWAKSWNSEKAKKERYRLGYSGEVGQDRSEQGEILEAARVVNYGAEAMGEEIYDAAIELIAKTVSGWCEEPNAEAIDNLADAVRKEKRRKDLDATAKSEIIRIFLHFFRQGILPTEDQIERKIRFDGVVNRAEEYYQKGGFVSDLKSVGLDGIRVRKRGRRSKSKS